jgi:antitoxin component of MazEF toxin-antitoxin module
VEQWGNSSALRIPKSVALAARLKIGDVLEVEVQGPGRLSMGRKQRTLILEKLVSGIPHNSLHDKINWDPM